MMKKTFKILIFELMLLTLCNGHCDWENFDSYIKDHNLSTLKNTLYLLENRLPESVNDIFIRTVQKMGFKVEIIPNTCSHSEQVMATWIVDELLHNVINLQITDTLEEKIYDKLEYLGFRTPNITNIKCIGDGNMTIDVDQCYNGSVKLVSKSILKYKLLTDFITHFYVDKPQDPEEESKWKRYNTISKDITKEPFKKWSILVCFNNYKKSIIIKNIKNRINIQQFRNIPVRFVNKCEVNDYSIHDLFAIVTPKPFEQENKVVIPVLFYETPYLLPEHEDMFQNHIEMYTNHFNVMKLGLMKFIELKQWNRVALLNDDSPYSENFGKDLISLFIDKRMVYIVKDCSQKVCEFTQALRSLKKLEATIIIANVEEKYAMKLMEAAKQTEMTFVHGVMWIWRDWPFKDDQSTMSMGDVFSIFSTQKPLTADRNINGDILESDKIINSLYNLRRVWKIMEKDVDKQLEINKTKLYRNIRNRIRNTSFFITEQWVHIRKLYSGKSNVICSLHIPKAASSTDKVVIQGTHNDIMKLPSDLRSPCTFRSYKFDEICQDTLLLLEMCVVCGFLVSVFVIIIFFMNYARSSGYSQM